jgi:DNA-binding winged helix-turn-helix (wHTH) protein
VFCFDEFELDVEAQELKRAGDVVKADGLVLRLLEAFVRRPGALISKEELVALVWNGRVVSENALTVAVARLRKTLAIERGVREVLLTVQGRGYRFLRAVSTREPEATGKARPSLPEGGAPFVGRESVISQLKQALAEARRGHGSLIVLRGEPGIGKTRLAEVFAQEAAAGGHAVAWGYCRELGETPPLWPFVGLLREVVARLPAATRNDPRFAALLPELGVLLPELTVEAEPAPSGRTVSHAGLRLPPKLRVFDAVTRALTMAAETRPAVLIVDDLHRADPASYELLHYLLAELPRARVLIVATLRSSSEVATDSPVARVLGHPSSGHVTLARLGEAEVLRYLAALFGDVDRALGRAVLRISEGNPFYMTELARQWRNGNRRDLAALTVPAPALDLVHQRLASLDERARDVLSCAAVVGRSFGLAVLSAITGRDAAALMPSLDAAIAAEVLSPAPNLATEFVFAHELLRCALYESLGAAEQRRWHLRVLAVLDQRRPPGEVPVADLAYHARCALPEGDLRRAVQYCTHAANDAARMCAFADAIRYLQSAREALDLIPDASPRLRLGLLMQQAALVRAHSARDFLPLAEQLLRMAREQPGSPSLAYATLLLDPFPGFPRLPILSGALEDALASLPEDPPILRAALLARLASSAPLAYDAVASAEQLERALDLSARSPEPADRFSARFGELYLYGGPAHSARAASALGELQRLCDDHGSAPLPGVLLEFHRALTGLQAGALGPTARALDRCESMCRDLDTELLWHVERFRALMRINQGDGAGGRVELQAVQRRANGWIVGSELFCAYDQIVVLETRDVRSASLRTLMPDPSDPPNIWALKLRALCAAGCQDEAQRALARLPAERLARLPCDREFLGTFGALARAALCLGAEAHCRAIYECLSPYPEHFAANLSFYCEGSVSLLLGLLARSFGDLASARDHFEVAAVLSERAGLAPSAAAARLERNRC